MFYLHLLVITEAQNVKRLISEPHLFSVIDPGYGDITLGDVLVLTGVVHKQQLFC